MVANRDGNFALPAPLNPSLLTLSHVGFPHSAKMMGVEMGQNFKLTPWDEAGMGLEFLDPPRPTLPYITKGYKLIIVNFSYPKTLLFILLFK